MVPEQLVMILVADNLELSCLAIEQAAKDRAAAEIDEALIQSFDARRRHTQVNRNSSLVDMRSHDTVLAPTESPLLGSSGPSQRLSIDSA